VALAASAAGSVPNDAAATTGAREFRAPTSALVHTGRSLLRATSRRPVAVVVKLDADPVALYSGGVPGLAPTSPSVTGRRIGPTRSGPGAPAEAAAVRAYVGYLAGLERRVMGRIRDLAPSARVLARYRFAYGGLALWLPANRAAALLRVPGVVAVQRATLEHPLTDVTPGFLHASDLWPSLGGAANAGQGVLVGVIDTGIWPEHPSFIDTGLPDPRPGHTYPCLFGDGTHPVLGPAFTCTHKLVGASAFTATYLAEFGALAGEFCRPQAGTCSARDADGHGTHTASTAAGDHDVAASIFGVSRGQVSGMAPGASIIAYRACLSEGCTGPDLLAAVDRAIQDGVDVINYSISGGTWYEDPVELGFLSAYGADVVVNAAAGNAGPAAGTMNHVAPWTVTVGASTSPRQFATSVHLAAGGDSLDVTGVSVTAGIASPAPVVLAQDVPGSDGPFCGADLPAGSATGSVVVCRRGGDVARVDKGYHVLQGGAAGMLLTNAAVQDVETDNHLLPAVHLDLPAAEQLLAFLAAHPGGVTATWPQGQATAAQPDVLAAFSSRGPAGSFVKPDVVAPGVQILAGKSPEPVETFGGPPGELFQAIAGTSMAAPHSAGVSALLRAAHPAWTAGQIKSALMTSAVTNPVLEDGATPASPFDMGSGRIRADTAAATPLTFDVPAQTYVDEIGDTTHHLDLNLPSVDAPAVPGTVTTTRTATNVTGAEQAFHVEVAGPSGAAIDVTPATFTVPTGGSEELTITIDGSALPAGQYFGSIELVADGPSSTDVRLPVAFGIHQGVVTLATSCAATDLAAGATTTCSVTVSNTAGGSTTYDLALHADTAAANLAVVDPGPPAVPDGNGFTATDTLQPSTAPLITELRSGGPAFVDLRARGVAPLTGVGDESVVNIATGSSHFLFGGSSYHTIGMTSNGYAVIGGADRGDVSFTPQALPDPMRPNNVLAPYWTDLNPAAGGKLYASRVRVGDARYLVLEWRRVRVYHSTDVETFEIWIRLGRTQRVSFAYGTVTGAATPSGLVVGAENSDGTSAATLGALPTSGARYVVRTSGPRPGETESIRYSLTAGVPGDYTVTAVMHSPLVPGQTVVKVPVHVHA